MSVEIKPYQLAKSYIYELKYLKDKNWQVTVCYDNGKGVAYYHTMNRDEANAAGMPLKSILRRLHKAPIEHIDTPVYTPQPDPTFWQKVKEFFIGYY